MSESEYRPVNLDAIETYALNLLEPALVIHWSGYVAEPTARARVPWGRISKQLIDTEKAPYGNLHHMPNGDDYALKPADTRGSNSLPLRWTAEGDFRLNLRKLLKLTGISVTKGYRLIIPVDFQELPTLGDCMILRFTQRRLEKIKPRKKQETEGEAI
jgi:hypothetical protein